jgi:hypothetical protein
MSPAPADPPEKAVTDKALTEKALAIHRRLRSSLIRRRPACRGPVLLALVAQQERRLRQREGDRERLALVLDSVFDLTQEGWRKLTFRWGLFFFFLAAVTCRGPVLLALVAQQERRLRQREGDRERHDAEHLA